MAQVRDGELDQRQRRTRAALHDALERLLERLPYAQIGISQLAEEAGVGRPTFYRHFPTVHALLIDRITQDYLEQRSIAKRLAEAGRDKYLAQLEITVFALERIAHKPKLYRALLDGSAGANGVTLFREQLTHLTTHLPFPTGDARNDNPDLAISMMSGAISGFLLAWLEAGRQPEPAEASKLLLAMLNLRKESFADRG